MKPTQHNSLSTTNRNLRPLTDFQYQSRLENSGATATAATAGTETPERIAFWKLGATANLASVRDHVLELALLGLIGAVAAWPILFMVVSVTRMVRNY